MNAVPTYPASIRDAIDGLVGQELGRPRFIEWQPDGSASVSKEALREEHWRREHFPDEELADGISSLPAIVVSGLPRSALLASAATSPASLKCLYVNAENAVSDRQRENISVLEEAGCPVLLDERTSAGRKLAETVPGRLQGLHMIPGYTRWHGENLPLWLQHSVMFATLDAFFHAGREDHWKACGITAGMWDHEWRFVIEMCRAACNDDGLLECTGEAVHVPGKWDSMTWVDIAAQLVTKTKYDRLDTGEPLLGFQDDFSRLRGCLALWRAETSARGIRLSLSDDDEPERRLDTLRVLADGFGIAAKVRALNAGVPFADIVG